MRKDVKAGLALSIVVIIAGVWYFWGSGSPNEPIALENGESTAPAVTLTARPQPTAVPRINRNANRETAQRPSPESSRDDRRANRDRVAPRLANRNLQQPAVQPSAQSSTPKPEPLTSADSASPSTGNADRTGPQPGKEPVGPTMDRDSDDDASPLASAQQPPRSDSEPKPGAVSPRPRSTAVSPSAASPAAPKPGEGDAAVETYEVRKGDTMAQIAVIFYGSERYVDFLVKSNPQVVSPRSIAEGMVLRIPALPDEATLAAATRSNDDASGPKPERPADAGQTYTVKEGDSFYAIALRTLGAGSRWPEIYELNKSVVGADPAKLRPGTVLKLPAKEAAKSEQARSN